ncbi:MFS transporter [Oerskovia sp. Sa1BUA8]|uniref:MFS transporter n=1 Tax=Oerskovia douganii TaxID=2762210 RepID=A0A9D5UCT4_9CELL|nr:MFS transporter [Oerskovia douganii]MBE7702328.1 MFS transporter [Oerskovia douganii]
MSGNLTVVRARWSLMALFALFGIVGTSWMTRLPSIREALGVTSAQLGLILIVGAVGALFAVMSTGAVVARFGSRRTLVAATAVNLVALLLVAWGTATGSVGIFAVGAFTNGISGALMNVPINLNGAMVEQRVGRAILPHFHAAFSIGAGAGALVGAAFSWAEIHIALQLVVITSLVAAARAFLIVPATVFAPELQAADGEAARPAGVAPSVPGTGRAQDDATAGAADVAAEVADSPAGAATEPAVAHGVTDGPPPPVKRRGSGLRSALGAWREPRTLLIGLVLLAASLSEGSAGNWLSISMVDGFAVREAVGAMAYGTFVAAMTVFRFAGTGLIDRFGRVTVLRASGVSALVGLLLFGLAPGLPLAWLGIVLWGCGAALANPVAIAAASDDPLRAPARVSVVTSFISFGQLTAPPVLGLLADAIGGRHALLTITAATVVSIALAGWVRPLPAQTRTLVTERT